MFLWSLANICREQNCVKKNAFSEPTLYIFPERVVLHRVS